MSVKNFYLILISALALAVVVVALWANFQIISVALSVKQEPTEKAHMALVKPPVKEFQYMFEIEQISVPLVDRSSSRIAYAQFGLVFDCPSETAKEQLKLHRAKLLDVIYQVASGFYIEDFEGKNGFTPFKAALLSAFEKQLHELTPRTVAINNWVLN